MTTDFEKDLRDALEREASRAPELPNGWQPELTLDAPSTYRSSRILLIAACLIILAGGAGLFLTQRESNPQDVLISNTTGDSSNGPDVTPTAPTTQLTTVRSVPDDIAPTTGLKPMVPIVGGAVIQRLAIGDMLMLGAADELAAAGFTVDAAANRHFADVVDILATLRAEGRLGEVVVLSLGENGSISQTAVDRAMTELADVGNVIILTNAADRPWTAANNSLIYELAATRSNVKLLDWMGLKENCSGDCFYEDGDHLRPDGAEFYADLITDRVDELTGMTSASQPLPPANTISRPSTTATEPAARWLDLAELAVWMGTWSMQQQTVTADIGSTGFYTYTLETTPTSFCIRTGGGGGCTFVTDASTPFDPPTNFGWSGASANYAADRWNHQVLVPPDVEVRALQDGNPICGMQRFTLEPYAPVALWACEGDGSRPPDVDYEFTRGPDVVMWKRPSAPPERPDD